MPLIWERIPTAVESEWPGGHPHPCNSIYRLHVPGGWLIRDEIIRFSEENATIHPAAGPTIFIPDPDHEWQVVVEPPRVREPIASLLVEQKWSSMEVFQFRGGLQRTLRKLRKGTLSLGFIGGSITDGRTGYSWPEPVLSWFVAQFPQVRIIAENAAIGATGSDLAVFRAQRDLIDRGCDLVFVEFAVNDAGEAAEKRRRTREGLLRKLLAGDGRDVVLVYTFGQPMYADMMHERVPETIADFEVLAEHYRLPSVWMGLHALNEVRAGGMRWEEWLPDGVHPQHRGSFSYAQSVTAFLERELLAAPSPDIIPVGEARPPALDAKQWESATALPCSQVRTTGPWVLRRWLNMPWMDYVLTTAAPGARLSFIFEGRALALGCDFGTTSAEFRYRLDNSGWIPVVRERPTWCGPAGWYRLTLLADDLPTLGHECEVEVIHGDRAECTGTNFNLALIGVVK